MPVKSAVRETIREDLLRRKRRLEVAVSRIRRSEDLERILDELDSALSRIDSGTYGCCEICNGSVAEEDLLANPLARWCLCNLTPEQQAAHQNDLDLAWKIQAGLLPDPDLEVGEWQVHSRYEPSGPVSGDYCDVASRNGKSGDLVFFVGDVSGKGVSAALLMAHLNASLRNLLDLGLPLPDLVARASQRLFESSLSSQFATLVGGRANGNGEVEICNAGHCPPLLVGPDGVRAVESGGPPAGMFQGTPYSVEVVEVAPKESLFLYTDGVTETFDTHGREYGLDRLGGLLQRNHHLAPRALAQLCLDDLDAFRAGAARSDDLTLMVIQRT